MEINYTEDWYMDNFKTKEEWDTFVKVMESLGVKVEFKVYQPEWRFLASHVNRGIIRRLSFEPYGIKVDVLGAIERLLRPIKTEEEKKIEELEATIRKASEQIEEIKNSMK